MIAGHFSTPIRFRSSWNRWLTTDVLPDRPVNDRPSPPLSSTAFRISPEKLRTLSRVVFSRPRNPSSPAVVLTVRE